MMAVGNRGSYKNSLIALETMWRPTREKIPQKLLKKKNNRHLLELILITNIIMILEDAELKMKTETISKFARKVPSFQVVKN